MSQYQPQIQRGLTRAAVSIAAWWVLFYRLHRPETIWRRITLLIAMPAAYAFWILIPMSIVANAVSWATIDNSRFALYSLIKGGGSIDENVRLNSETPDVWEP